MINPFNVNIENQKIAGAVNVPAMLGIPNEVLDVGKYDPLLIGENVQCKDWDNNQVLDFLNNINERHDLFIPVGFMETIEKDPYQLYCDTDSVVGTSVIKFGELYDKNYKEETIENLWNLFSSIEVEEYKDTKEIKDISSLDIYTPGISTNDGRVKTLSSNKIKKIIRHKISKSLWKLTPFFSDDFVIVTEDHSLIFSQPTVGLISVTINEILNSIDNFDERFRLGINNVSKKDENNYRIELSRSAIIKLPSDKDNFYFKFDGDEDEYFMDICFDIYKLSEEEAKEFEYVYDLEVENQPVFFANNILVHNSDYLLIKLTFDKNEDHRKTVDYCQRMTLRMNEAYMSALDLYFYKIANWHPDYNTMDFKSEVVAYRGFFCTKKFYALGKVWDEGKFLGELETKKTGGQIKKADATKVSKEMLSDIYKLLTVDQSIDDEVVLYNKIFIEIKNKYVMKLKDAIKNSEFEYFTIPKKWSFGDKKNIPPAISGAKLYNRVIKDSFAVGDAVLVLPIKYNMQLMKKEFEKTKNPNEFMMQNNELTSKINVISLPPASKLGEKDKEFIRQRFQELQIQLDYDTIMNFNIDMKLAPFKNLFNTEITRRAMALSGH